MAEIVNLNRARKQRERAAKALQAAANRASHGRTKAERVATRVETARRDTVLDGARRDEEKA
jgi:hypothetical protein